MPKSKITGQQREAIKQQRASGQTLAAIGDNYGLSRQRVSQITKGITPAKSAITKQEATQSRLDFSALGTTGLQRSGGFVTEEFINDLYGQRAAAVYKEMLYNDAIVAAAMRTIEMTARQVKWNVSPGEPTDEAKEHADFVDSIFSDMTTTWDDTTAEMLSMIPFGFCLNEKIFKRRLGHNKDRSKSSQFNDGKIGLSALPIRAQDTIVEWEFDDNTGEVIGAWQSASPNYNRVFLPMEKLLHFRSTTHKNNPEGFALLRNAYTSYYFRKQLMNMQSIGLERNATGMPIVRMPSADMLAGTGFFTSMQKAVRRIRINDQMGLIIPSDRDENGHHIVDFEFASVQGTMPDFETPIKRYNMEIAIALMADFILLGHETVGSFALADSKTHTFALSLGAWLDSIAAVINKDLIPQLLRLNGISTDNPPQLTHSDIETPDLNIIGTFIQALAGSGMSLFPNQELETWLLRALGAPESAIDDMQRFFDRDMTARMADTQQETDAAE